jgi:uncharacterized BrkB/YihY/UPF0761 family membrane protein
MNAHFYCAVTVTIDLLAAAVVMVTVVAYGTNEIYSVKTMHNYFSNNILLLLLLLLLLHPSAALH